MPVSKNKRRHTNLMDQGERDMLDGKPVDAFYDLNPADFNTARLNEGDRSSYTIGWRSAKRHNQSL